MSNTNKDFLICAIPLNDPMRNSLQEIVKLFMYWDTGGGGHNMVKSKHIHQGVNIVQVQDFEGEEVGWVKFLELRQ